MQRSDFFLMPSNAGSFTIMLACGVLATPRREASRERKGSASGSKRSRQAEGPPVIQRPTPRPSQHGVRAHATGCERERERERERARARVVKPVRLKYRWRF